MKQVNTQDTDGEEPEWKSRPDKFPLEEIDANAAIETGLLHSYRVPPENPRPFVPASTVDVEMSSGNTSPLVFVCF